MSSTSTSTKYEPFEHELNELSYHLMSMAYQGGGGSDREKIEQVTEYLNKTENKEWQEKYQFVVLDVKECQGTPVYLVNFRGTDNLNHNAVTAKGWFGDSGRTADQNKQQVVTSAAAQFGNQGPRGLIVSWIARKIFGTPAHDQEIDVIEIAMDWAEKYGNITNLAGHSNGGRVVMLFHKVLAKLNKHLHFRKRVPYPRTVTFNSQKVENLPGTIHIRVKKDPVTSWTSENSDRDCITIKKELDGWEHNLDQMKPINNQTPNETKAKQDPGFKVMRENWQMAEEANIVLKEHLDQVSKETIQEKEAFKTIINDLTQQLECRDADVGELTKNLEEAKFGLAMAEKKENIINANYEKLEQEESEQSPIEKCTKVIKIADSLVDGFVIVRGFLDERLQANAARKEAKKQSAHQKNLLERERSWAQMAYIEMLLSIAQTKEVIKTAKDFQLRYSDLYRRRELINRCSATQTRVKAQLERSIKKISKKIRKGNFSENISTGCKYGAKKARELAEAAQNPYVRAGAIAVEATLKLSSSTIDYHNVKSQLKKNKHLYDLLRQQEKNQLDGEEIAQLKRKYDVNILQEANEIIQNPYAEAAAKRLAMDLVISETKDILTKDIPKMIATREQELAPARNKREEERLKPLNSELDSITRSIKSKVKEKEELEKKLTKKQNKISRKGKTAGRQNKVEDTSEKIEGIDNKLADLHTRKTELEVEIETRPEPEGDHRLDILETDKKESEDIIKKFTTMLKTARTNATYDDEVDKSCKLFKSLFGANTKEGNELKELLTYNLNKFIIATAEDRAACIQTFVILNELAYACGNDNFMRTAQIAQQGYRIFDVVRVFTNVTQPLLKDHENLASAVYSMGPAVFLGQFAIPALIVCSAGVQIWNAYQYAGRPQQDPMQQLLKSHFDGVYHALESISKQSKQQTQLLFNELLKNRSEAFQLASTIINKVKSEHDKTRALITDAAYGVNVDSLKRESRQVKGIVTKSLGDLVSEIQTLMGLVITYRGDVYNGFNLSRENPRTISSAISINPEYYSGFTAKLIGLRWEKHPNLKVYLQLVKRYLQVEQSWIKTRIREAENVHDDNDREIPMPKEMEDLRNELKRCGEALLAIYGVDQIRKTFAKIAKKQKEILEILMPNVEKGDLPQSGWLIDQGMQEKLSGALVGFGRFGLSNLYANDTIKEVNWPNLWKINNTNVMIKSKFIKNTISHLTEIFTHSVTGVFCPMIRFVELPMLLSGGQKEVDSFHNGIRDCLSNLFRNDAKQQAGWVLTSLKRSSDRKSIQRFSSTSECMRGGINVNIGFCQDISNLRVSRIDDSYNSANLYQYHDQVTDCISLRIGGSATPEDHVTILDSSPFSAELVRSIPKHNPTKCITPEILDDYLKFLKRDPNVPNLGSIYRDEVCVIPSVDDQLIPLAFPEKLLKEKLVDKRIFEAMGYRVYPQYSLEKGENGSPWKLIIELYTSVSNQPPSKMGSMDTATFDDVTVRSFAPVKGDSERVSQDLSDNHLNEFLLHAMYGFNLEDGIGLPGCRTKLLKEGKVVVPVDTEFLGVYCYLEKNHSVANYRSQIESIYPTEMKVTINKQTLPDRLPDGFQENYEEYRLLHDGLTSLLVAATDLEPRFVGSFFENAGLILPASANQYKVFETVGNHYKECQANLKKDVALGLSSALNFRDMSVKKAKLIHTLKELEKMP